MKPAPSEDVHDWLALVNCALDRAVLTRLVQNAACAAEILEASDEELSRRHGLNIRQLDQLRRIPPRRKLDEQRRLMDKHSMELIPLGDPRFPRNLFEMRLPPPLVFIKGEVVDSDCLAVGIVGPRAATPYGLEVTARLARDFAPLLTVVSGAALGIDSVAHETALRAGGRTVAVLGCGIDINYPSSNEPLRMRIAREGGALLSTFPPGTAPMRGNFPARNFILAGLSLAVIVVEASAKSGALVTARAAGEEGRPVYAVPGDITRRNSEGSNALIRDGATLCTSAQDVIADLEPILQGELGSLRQRREPQGEQPPAPPAISPMESMLLDVIRHAPVSHDNLIASLVPHRISLGELSTALLMLEMDGRIQQLPGRVYAPRL